MRQCASGWTGSGVIWESEREHGGDNLACLISGEVVLISNAAEQILKLALCAGYAAGKCLVSLCQDDDLRWVETEGGTIAAHKDGRRYE